MFLTGLKGYLQCADAGAVKRIAPLRRVSADRFSAAHQRLTKHYTEDVGRTVRRVSARLVGPPGHVFTDAASSRRRCIQPRATGAQQAATLNTKQFEQTQSRQWSGQ